MGESDRNHRNEQKPRRRKHLLSLGADNNALVMLFAVNAVFFLVLEMIKVGVLADGHEIDFFNSRVLQWIELPAGLTKLSERPWTILSYMFTDTGVMLFRIISNMIWLWAFGSLLQQMAGNAKLVPVYIYGGLLGGIFFIAARYLLIPHAELTNGPGLLGANAAVMAVAVTTTTLEPNYRFFTQIGRGIPVWVLTTIYILIDFAGIAGVGGAYSLAHLGGALAGFLFVVFLRKGYDGSAWMNRLYHWLFTIFEPKPSAAGKAKNKIFYKTGHREPFVKTTGITQKRVDEILDKINQKGYNFLTDEEKDFLKKAAEDENL